MKRALLALAVAGLLASCGSANQKIANQARPQLALEQLVGPSELGYPAGRIDVQFALHVGNRGDQLLTVKRVEIATISTGAYTLRRESFPFQKQIAPGTADSVTFWAHGYARGGGPMGFGAQEPVTVRIIVYFNTPAGAFQQALTRDLGQWDR